MNYSTTIQQQLQKIFDLYLTIIANHCFLLIDDDDVVFFEFFKLYL